MDSVLVLLENEKGESRSLAVSDSLLYRMGIGEGSKWPGELFPGQGQRAGLSFAFSDRNIL